MFSRSLLGGAPLLREHPEDELALHVGVKGGGDDHVLPGGQAEPLGDLPQVDVGLALGRGLGVEEELFPQVLLAATHLSVESRA